MTDEQAALCVQAYWRRYLSVIYYQVTLTLTLSLSLTPTPTPTLTPALTLTLA